MASIIDTIIAQHSSITFTKSDIHSWSPKLQQITYYVDQTDESIWATLHELGHARLQHTTYHTDLRLLRMEVEAWQEAIALAEAHELSITDDHIQSCLDTYRDWLHKRSTCPTCERHGIQDRTTGAYSCFNCSSVWQVSSERFCRPYRLIEASTKK